ncbi:MAG: flagellin [Desulfovibrionaceae bacterium]
MATFSLNFNKQAFTTRSALFSHEQNLQTAIEKLSTGKKYNKTSDGPAAFNLLSKLGTDVLVGEQGVVNGKNGTTLLDTTDSALASMETILTKIAVLSEDSANGVWTPEQREVFDTEAQSLLQVIDNIALSTEFNGKKPLMGDFSGTTATNSLTLQLGTTNAGHDQLILTIESARSEELFAGFPEASAGKLMDLTTQASSLQSLSNANAALANVRDQRANMGATQNAISFNIKNRESMNTESRNTISNIGDADVALEMENYTNNMAKVQAASYTYSIALQNPSRILQMIQSV